MATILLSAAGAAIGGSIGGTVLGLSAAVVGQAAGATLGRALDQRLLGGGGRAVETGRLDRYRLTGASEGAPIGQVYARMRIGGQVIWATRFREVVNTSGGGKGAPSTPKIKEYSYTVSLAVALCEGEIGHVGRVWADGAEVPRSSLPMRVHRGTEDQLPDSAIEAVEGAGMAPAYRGTAYVVFEDLDLSPYGNRVPQFSFEVIRPAQEPPAGGIPDLAGTVRGVALMPGSGEYTLATTPVHYQLGPAEARPANVNTLSGISDIETSLEALKGELPRCEATLLVASWFGDDLRCGVCRLRPKVEQTNLDGAEMPWRSGGIGREAAEIVPMQDGRPVYGGTPADASLVEAIAALKTAGQAVTFYPFILMEQMPGNGLPDPWTGAPDQPPLPWRGRITASAAPGQPGTSDQTPDAEAEVAAFFGAASPADFSVDGSRVDYSGPDEWSFRRFILHYAHLCVAAGGVEAFCIGSEMRGLTQLRSARRAFPAVEALRALAADVRSVLGPDTRIGYAADWSEYFGYQPQDGTGDRLFHLDPLWADPNIDFIGIDNYMPLADWRDGPDHLDAPWGSIWSLDYLRANIEGGEGYDWYYHSPEAEAAQIRTPIEDGEHGEPWVWRYKDIRSWWENLHHDRVDGLRMEDPSPWVPRSKPFWFTEYGCPAVDKGANQPNLFVDPKSSESSLPRHSDGRRDDLMQLAYLSAMASYWEDAANNPVSDVYGEAMVDTARMHAWAWDARPYPAFPRRTELWSDGENYARGHWVNGRASGRSLASVVAEICEQAGITRYDVSRLWGYVRGYHVPELGSARAALQPLMLAHGFDAVEREGRLVFATRTGLATARLDQAGLAITGETETALELARSAEAEIEGRVQIGFIEADGDYEIRSAEASFPGEPGRRLARSEVSLVLTGAEGRAIAERWLAEARTARDTARFALPPSRAALGAGDVVDLDGAGRYRIDRAESLGATIVEAVRVAPQSYLPSDAVEAAAPIATFAAPTPVLAQFLDLPLLRGDEAPHAPHLAATAIPWPGEVAVFSAPLDGDYALDILLSRAAAIGETLTPLAAARPGLIDHGPPLEVQLYAGTLAEVSMEALLSGANMMAIGTGESSGWELFQFAGAALLAPGRYLLSHRLRGQAGTEADMPATWPAGSRIVLLDGAPRQVTLAPSSRNVARHFRVGPAARGYDDPSYRHLTEAFAGIGLRPYAPAHLAAAELGNGDLRLGWTRRTRIDGDGWEAPDVPLGEAFERYLVTASRGGVPLRSVETPTPEWLYTAAERAADGHGDGQGTRLSVAQLSDRFGPGPATHIDLPG